MAGNNQLVPFGTGTGANVVSPTSWAGANVRQAGFTDGIADTAQCNTAWRQASIGSALLGAFIASQGYDALDNGDLAGLLANFESALGAYSAASGPNTAALWHTGDDTSAIPGKITATVSPAITSYGRYQYAIKVAQTCPGVTTANLNGLGNRGVERNDGSPLQPGDYVAGQVIFLSDDGYNLQLVGLARGEVQRVVTTATTLYVRTDGSDSNDGSANTAARAFKKPAAAIAYGLSRFSLVGGTLNIQLGNAGSYEAPGIIPATVGTLAITGDPNNPTQYTLNGTNTVSPIFAQGTVSVNGCAIVNNASGYATATASAGGFLTIQNCTFGTSVTGTAHIAAGNTGIISIGSGCTIVTGNANCITAVTSGNVQLGGNLALQNSPGFTGAFAFASSNGSIGVSPGVSFPGASGGGTRYIVSLNGSISTSGGGANFFPGNAAGQNDGTGAYA